MFKNSKDLQKQALTIGLPKQLTKISISFGFESSYLSGVFKRGEQPSKRFMNIWNLHKKNYELQKEVDRLMQFSGIASGDTENMTSQEIKASKKDV